MSLFDEFGKKVTQAGNDAIKKTKEFSDITRINSMISECDKKIQSYYLQLGKKFYEDNCGEQLTVYQDLIDAINEQRKQIEELKDQINVIKGVKYCDKCGAEVSDSALFCSSCGNKIGNPEREIPEGAIKCSKCGEIYDDTLNFCTKCGNKLR